MLKTGIIRNADLPVAFDRRTVVNVLGDAFGTVIIDHHAKRWVAQAAARRPTAQAPLPRSEEHGHELEPLNKGADVSMPSVSQGPLAAEEIGAGAAKADLVARGHHHAMGPAQLPSSSSSSSIKGTWQHHDADGACGTSAAGAWAPSAGAASGSHGSHGHGLHGDLHFGSASELHAGSEWRQPPAAAAAPTQGPGVHEHGHGVVSMALPAELAAPYGIGGYGSEGRGQAPDGDDGWGASHLRHRGPTPPA